MTEKKNKLTFGDLRIGEKFKFASEYTDWKYEPLVKISSRTYQFGKKRYTEVLKEQKNLARIYNYSIPRSLKPMRVGSIKAEVKRGW